MDPFLRAAIDEAKLGPSEGGLPIGPVLVSPGVMRRTVVEVPHALGGTPVAVAFR